MFWAHLVFLICWWEKKILPLHWIFFKGYFNILANSPVAIIAIVACVGYIPSNYECLLSWVLGGRRCEVCSPSLLIIVYTCILKGCVIIPAQGWVNSEGGRPVPLPSQQTTGSANQRDCAHSSGYSANGKVHFCQSVEPSLQTLQRLFIFHLLWTLNMWLHDSSVFSRADFLVCVSPLLLTLPEREHIYRDFLFFSISVIIIMTVNEAELNFKID